MDQLPAVLAGVVIVLVGVYLIWTAGRIDRAHARLEAAAATLDAQLLRRSSVALELSAAGLLDPASSLVVADAAHGARSTPESGRERAESVLTGALEAALTDRALVAWLRQDPESAGLVEELEAACRRVELARRFHNDAARVTRRLRRKRLVRWLRLAGRAPMPQTVEFDDAVPSGLSAT